MGSDTATSFASYQYGVPTVPLMEYTERVCTDPNTGSVMRVRVPKIGNSVTFHDISHPKPKPNKILLLTETV
jgi:hypothetical protein